MVALGYEYNKQQAYCMVSYLYYNLKGALVAPVGKTFCSLLLAVYCVTALTSRRTTGLSDAESLRKYKYIMLWALLYCCTVLYYHTTVLVSS